MKTLTVLYRLGFGLLALAAVAVQFWHGHAQGFSSVNFFSYFTIESNLFAAAIFLLAAAGLRSETFQYIRGAATLYMIVTGIVYALLLSGIDVQTPIPWVNAVLHYIFPVAVLVDWLISPPRQKLQFRKALLWLIFPLLYASYSVARGHSVDWYPYPFLNATKLGYASVTMNSLALAVSFFALTFVVVRLPRAAKRG